MNNFKSGIYPEILKRLSKDHRYFTKKENQPNFVKIDGDTVMVRTIKSRNNYEIIPYTFFEKTWNILLDKGRVKQRDLSQIYNVKRSAFMFIAFDLLDAVSYKEYNNSLTLTNRIPKI